MKRALVVLGVLLTPSLAAAQPADDDDGLGSSEVQYAPSTTQPATPTQTALANETKPAEAAPPPASATTPPAGAAEAPPARTANNALWAELLGNGGIYSFNYERFFAEGNVGLRAGFSYLPVSADDGTANPPKVTLLTFPVLVNYYGVGGRNHKLQLGGGFTFLYASAKTDALSANAGGVILTASLGYRYMPADGGFNFFIGLTPLFHPKGDPPLLPLPGIGLGAVF